MPDTPDSSTPVFACVRTARRCIFVATLISGIAAAGCNSSKSPSTTGGKSTSKPAETRAVVSLESCVAELQPNEFGINVPVDLPLSGLNDWADVDLADRLSPLVDEELLREELAESLDDELIERILRRRFVTRDATHARDAIWAQQTVSNLRTRDKTLETRVFGLFYYTIHTVQLASDSVGGLPLPPYESAFFGRGSAADRAWVFATLLHELKIPTAVVRLPENNEPDSSDDEPESDSKVRLIAVLLDGKLHLFDVVLGLPVPSLAENNDSDSTALPQNAANLSEATSNDNVFRQLDSESEPYPVTADGLQQATLEIIGDTTLWSRRMEGLSEALTGDQSVTLYRPLVSAGDQDGSLNVVRDSASGLIASEKIGVWLWPERRREAGATMTAEQKRQLKELKNAFQTPLPITAIGPELVVINEQIRVPRLSIGTGWRYLLKARTSQLQGRTAEAIEFYIKIQGFSPLPPTIDETVLQSLPQELASQFGSANVGIKTRLSLGLPENVRLAHIQAGEAAEFWKATCLFEKRDWKSAAGALERYLRNQNSQQFTGAARLLMAVSLANDNQLRRATAFLKTVESSAPEYPAAQYLAGRWTRQSETE